MRRCAGQLGKGGHDIRKIAGKTARRSRFDPIGPADDQRDANPAFVEVALCSAPSGGTVKELHEDVAPGARLRPVVAGEKYDGVLVDPQPLERRHHLADLPVHPRYHAREFRQCILTSNVSGTWIRTRDLLPLSL